MRFSAVLAAVALTGFAGADHIYTQARWNGWTVTTGEESWFARLHTSYPIWQMFDRDPRTAWVFSGSLNDPNEAEEVDGKIVSRTLRTLEDRYWLFMKPDRARYVDTIRLMNGYNRDRSTFGRNARITKIEIFDTEWVWTDRLKPLLTTELPDAMGWHSIKIPRRKYGGLKIVVKSLARGTDPDVAISELDLLDGSRSVGPPKADYFLYTPGDDCGCGGAIALVRSDGKTVHQLMGEDALASQSPSGRYFAAFGHLASDLDEGRGVGRLWVYDAELGRHVLHRTLDKHRASQVWKLEWLGDRLVTPDANGKQIVLWQPRRTAGR